MKISVVEADKKHIHHLATHMRDSDVAELKAVGLTPRDALRRSLAVSERAWTCLMDSTPVAMFGVSTLGAEHGAPWLLATPDLERIKKAAWRLSKEYVDKMHELYPVLTNYIDTRNTRTIRWLAKLGFRPVEYVSEFGVEKLPFIRFERTA